MRKPTVKQQTFVNEILKGKSDSDAYRKAYNVKKMGDKAIRTEAAKLKKNPLIALLLEESKEKRQERVNFDADKVLSTLSDFIDADPIDIYNLENRCFLPIEDWPPVWRKMLTAIDNKELFSGKGKNAQKEGDIVKIKFIDKMRAIENIGKHVSVNAFKEVVEHNHKIELKDDELDARIAELEDQLKA